ncbi:MAG: type I-B CRISPR-associated protein Cas7/Cst2/DevR [Pirellulaceae bacterium]
MANSPTIKDAKAITVTFLTNVSLGSLNGSDKEADNVSSIKKLTRGSSTFPYMSSQAVRRALRDQLGVLGHELSEGVAAKESKGAAITQCEPKKYIDDDLFGFMDAARSGTHKRTSPVRVSPLLAMDAYEGDLDFGTNYMSVDAGGTPNIFETEIHGGLYRGTILIELDAVGVSRDGEKENAKAKETATPGKKTWEVSEKDKAARVIAVLQALQHLWSSGRQSRFLSDISPKFVAAAALTAKVPIFLESVICTKNGINKEALSETLADSKSILLESVYGKKNGMFNGDAPENCKTVGEAFEVIASWVNKHYGVE